MRVLATLLCFCVCLLAAGLLWAEQPAVTEPRLKVIFCGDIMLADLPGKAIERGVDPATLTRVEIPRDMFVSGTIQEIREYVALYLESHHSGTA